MLASAWSDNLWPIVRVLVPESDRFGYRPHATPLDRCVVIIRFSELVTHIHADHLRVLFFLDRWIGMHQLQLWFNTSRWKRRPSSIYNREYISISVNYQIVRNGARVACPHRSSDSDRALKYECRVLDWRYRRPILDNHRILIYNPIVYKQKQHNLKIGNRVLHNTDKPKDNVPESPISDSSYSFSAIEHH
jgi:hypothetical protein